MRWLAAIAAAAIVATAALSQTLGAGGGGHAWFVVTSPGSAHGALLHAPPRGGGVDAGELRLALTLTEPVDRIAAWGTNVYLLGPERRVRGQSRRSVGTVAVVREQDEWTLAPSGRTRPLPALEGAPPVVGFAGSPAGPVVLTLTATPKAPKLLVMTGEAWEEIRIPAPARSATQLALAAHPEGVALLATEGGTTTLWLGRGGSPDALEWEDSPTGFDSGSTRPVGTIFDSAGDLVCARRAGSSVELWAVGDDRTTRLAQLEGVGSFRWAAAPPGGGRAAVVWESPDAPTPAERVGMAEVSVFTGRVLYTGPARSRPPVSAVELRLIIGVLVMVGLVVVLIVLRPASDPGAVVIPRGTALASPSQRLFGGLIDLAIVVSITGVLTGGGAGDLVVLMRLLEPGREPDLALLVGLGMVGSAVCEWLWGRTPGKLLAGSWVASLPEGERAGFARCLVRNAVKWLASPVAIAAAATPGGRHLGELWSRTAVVTGVEEEPEAST